MKIVVDDKIPYIRETLAMLADEVVYVKGAAIGPDDVKDADALIVRTRTRCDEQLLRGSKVQFVATATIGYDHIDTAWLEQHGIAWTNCPGCNSGSVAQYVESAILRLIENGEWRMENYDYIARRSFRPDGNHNSPSSILNSQLESNHNSQFSILNSQLETLNSQLETLNSQLTLGIVGSGHVGSKVRRVGERLGLRVLVNDPPLQAATGADGFVALDVLEREADIITFHVPLDETTRHLADETFFSRLRRRPVIINSSRGGVVDEQALMRALADGRVRQAVIDTWEGEPDISRALLSKVYIGTPHIAGYSADGKVNADNMVVSALCRHFGLPLPPPIVAPPLSRKPQTTTADSRALELYDVMADSRALKAHPEQFEQLRGDYPLRREQWD